MPCPVIIDRLVTTLDRVRGLHARIGDRRWNIYTVLRTWNPAPSAPTLAVHGTPGTTTYTYALVAEWADGTVSLASTSATVTTGPATLSSVNHVQVTGAYPSGATRLRVYRLAGGTTQGKIATLNSPTLTVDDTGLAGDATTPSTDVPRRGFGSATDVETLLTPTPRVSVPSPWLQFAPTPVVKDEQGEIKLTEVSLRYTEAEINGGFSLAGNQEWLYKLVDSTVQAGETRYYVLASPPLPDREWTLGWIIRLNNAAGG